MAAPKREMTPSELWLLDLERERNDRSYLTPRYNRYEPQVATITRVVKTKAPTSKEQKERDRVFFHAGRFAAGARDTDALEANNKIGKLIHQKGTK